MRLLLSQNCPQYCSDVYVLLAISFVPYAARGRA